MHDEPQQHETERALAGWRLRWAFFAVVWVLLVVLLSTVLWPAFATLQPRELLLVIALVAVIPPALDYFFSLAIADVMARRWHRHS